MRIKITESAQLLLLCLASLAPLVYYFTTRMPLEVEFRDQKMKLLDDVFAALLKAVEFLNSDYSDINVDGLYGFRICQGSLIGTLHDCTFENLRCPEKLRYQLMANIERLNQLCSKALPYIEQKDKEYYRNYRPILEIPSIVKYIPEKWHRVPQRQAQSDKSYNIVMGDKCFRGIIGTFSHDGRKSPPCTIAGDCWEMMATQGTSGYFTTHQLLYLLFGEHSGCEQKLGDRLIENTGMSLRDWQRHLCEQIYIDATILEHQITEEETAEDLFLEQSALCGVLGFENFFNETWIRMVLGWQHARGCFIRAFQKIQDEEMYSLETEMSGGNDTFNKVTGRRLLAESIMNGDCLSHKTGVGAAALGTYLRYLVSELYIKI